MIHQPIEPPRREDSRATPSSGWAVLCEMFAEIYWPGVAVLAALGGIWLFCIVTAIRHFHEVFG